MQAVLRRPVPSNTNVDGSGVEEVTRSSELPVLAMYEVTTRSPSLVPKTGGHGKCEAGSQKIKVDDNVAKDWSN